MDNVNTTDLWLPVKLRKALLNAIQKDEESNKKKVKFTKHQFDCITISATALVSVSFGGISIANEFNISKNSFGQKKKSYIFTD